MSIADPVLASFAADLKKVVETGNIAQLADFLSGRNLPALGGDLEPSDVILRALAREPDLSANLAGLLVKVLQRKSEVLFGRSEISLRERLQLLNSLQLAAELPPDPRLFQLFCSFPEEQLPEEIRVPFKRALVYQQTDASLAEHWAKRLLFFTGKEDLILNWRGLLWVPARPAPNLDHIEVGLLRLFNTVRYRQNSSEFLQYALEILCETYPRSSQYWESSLAPRVGHWPEELQREVSRRWPRLGGWEKQTRLRAG